MLLSCCCCYPVVNVILLLANWFGVNVFGGVVYILGCLYLRGFDGLGGFCFGFFIWFFDFMLVWCFFDFLGVLIFGFFDAFLMFFWFFYDFFFWLLLCFYSPKWVHFLKFSCNSFFLKYNGWRKWWVTRKRHGVKFTALRLVFNRICKSIKKYKNVEACSCKLSMFTGCNLIFLGSTLHSLRFELMSLPCNL